MYYLPLRYVPDHKEGNTIAASGISDSLFRLYPKQGFEYSVNQEGYFHIKHKL